MSALDEPNPSFGVLDILVSGNNLMLSNPLDVLVLCDPIVTSVILPVGCSGASVR